MNTKINWKFVYRVFFAFIAWYGVIGHFIQVMSRRSPEASVLAAVIDYFSFFTIQSNFLVAIWWTIAILAAGSAAKRWFLSHRVKGALTAYITITCSVYALVLANMWDPTGLEWVYATITHYVTPLAFILDWLLFEKRGIYRWKFLPGWLIYPAAYFAFAMIYGIIKGRPQYPFFDYNALGWGGMIFQVALLLIFFATLGSLYIAINQLLGKLLPSSPLEEIDA